MNSQQYVALKRRIDYLSTQLLPKSNPTGNYSRKERDAIRAFLLLSHAELEFYFEAIGKRIAKRALDQWCLNHEYKSKVLTYLSTYTETTERIRRAATTEDRIKTIIGYYFVSLDDNNGIKEDSILKILRPIGVDYAKIDKTWLNTLTSYGANRGKIAHTSAKTQTLNDPKDILKDINYIMQELSPLDTYILKLR